MVRRLVAAVTIALLVAAGFMTSLPVAAATSVDVTIRNLAFNPTPIRVVAGNAVLWSNADGTSHTVTSDDGVTFNSGTLSPTQTFSQSFPSAGTYKYHCNIHSFMHGLVQVLAPQPQPTPGFNVFRSAGAQASSYLLGQIGDLYTQTGLFGCTLSADNRTCVVGADRPTTDTLDDYSRNEFVNGLLVGEDLGVGQLCGTSPTGPPGNLLPAPDFVRVTRPLRSGECGAALSFAADSVVGLVFPFNNQATIACTTGSCTAAQVGPVSAGWRPGDALAGPYSGQSFFDVSNQGPSGVAGSIAERIFCETGANRISDWGQLTDAASDPANPGHTKGTDGVGSPIGAPIYIPAVNPGSGTFALWATFAGCTNPNVNNADARMLQDSGAGSLANIAAADHPTDNIAAANQVAETLTYLSYGLSVWKPFTTFRGRRTSVDGLNASQADEVPTCATCIATRRTLSAVYNPTKLRASVATFLNWVCDTDPANLSHGVDLTTGRNYNDELTNTVGTVYFFPRLPCAVDSAAMSVPPLSASQVTDAST